MNITPRRRTVLPSQYQFHGNTLSTETEVEYIGVKITSDFRWPGLTDVCAALDSPSQHCSELTDS